MSRYTIFISDLHLDQNTPEIAKLFFRFIEKFPAPADALYILGDFFQYWAGDDNGSTFSEKIKNSLKKISDKIPIYLMVGNRDFLLGERFAKESGCILIPDPDLITLYGKPVLLSHGDTIYTNINYQIFRALIRCPYGIKLFMKLPLKIRLPFASALQKYSSRRKTLKSSAGWTPKPAAIKKLLNHAKVSQLIHGHIHLAAIREIFLDQQKIQVISLGAWGGADNILIYHDHGGFEFKTLL